MFTEKTIPTVGCKKCGRTRPVTDENDLKCYWCAGERRERIATAVLNALIHDLVPSDNDIRLGLGLDHTVAIDMPTHLPAFAARISCRYADALIAELDKDSEPNTTQSLVQSGGAE